MFTTVSVIKYIVRNMGDINALQLNKLLYIANGHHMAFYNEPLIASLPVATQYGPYYIGLYNCAIGSNPKRKVKYIDFDNESAFEWYDTSKNVGHYYQPLDAALKAYRKFNNSQLMGLVTSPDRVEAFAWWYTWNHLDGKNRPFMNIGDKLIGRTFRGDFTYEIYKGSQIDEVLEND